MSGLTWLNSQFITKEGSKERRAPLKCHFRQPQPVFSNPLTIRRLHFRPRFINELVDAQSLSSWFSISNIMTTGYINVNICGKNPFKHHTEWLMAYVPFLFHFFDFVKRLGVSGVEELEKVNTKRM